MKKFFTKLSVLALIVLFFSTMVLCVNSHPGRTDSSGGHTNHSTGEYHYHHGYQAHNHYDMDGDGDIDCPYAYDDKTNHSSVEGSGISSAIGDADKSIVWMIFESILAAIAIWLFSSYFLSYIFILIFGDGKGCSISMISGAIISLIASIWMISNKLS